MDNLSDAELIDIFEKTGTIAVVGFSMNPARPSHYVSEFLVSKGYRVVPVNPGHAGKEVLGSKVYASLADIEEPVDMVDIFRRSEAVPEVVEAVLRDLPTAKTIWMQLGVMHPAAAEQARAAGLRVAMNRCPKIEYPRLMPDLVG